MVDAATVAYKATTVINGGLANALPHCIKLCLNLAVWEQALYEQDELTIGLTEYNLNPNCSVTRG